MSTVVAQAADLAAVLALCFGVVWCVLNLNRLRAYCRKAGKQASRLQRVVTHSAFRAYAGVLMHSAFPEPIREMICAYHGKRALARIERDRKCTR